VNEPASLPRWAKALLCDNAFQSYGATFRALREAGFETGDIAVCIDDVRQVAMQHKVAMEMSDQ
jgi:urease accessory protein UreF